MITIKVGGKPLYIPKDTALVLEQSNNAFDNEGYMDDVVWTFELPAKPNQAVLGAVQYVYTGGRKRYECELSVDGVPFSKGTLYVQSATDARRLNCGIVTNCFGVGFGERMLKENDYGNDITISASEANHQSGWISFLQSSLAAESIYKFFLFADENFYSDNEDFGYHMDIISGLLGKNNEKQFCKYVNRLFFDSLGNIIQNPDRDGNNAKVRQGVRVFNTNDSGKRNGYCFAPAIRLDWMVRKVIQNAGLTSMGSFFSDKQIHNLFSQSLNAMDGDVFQYGVNTWLHVGGNINLYSDRIENGLKFNVDASINTFESFGWISGVNIGFRLLLPVEELVHAAIDQTIFVRNNTGDVTVRVNKEDEIYALVIKEADAELPNIRLITSSTEADKTKVFKYGKMPTGEELIKRADVNPTELGSLWFTGNGNCRFNYWWGPVPMSIHSIPFYTATRSTLIQLTRSHTKNVHFLGNLGGYTEGSVSPQWKPNWASTDHLFIQLVKCKIYSTNKPDILLTYNTLQFDRIEECSYGDIEFLTDYEVQESVEIDTTDRPLNIFSNIMRWKDHVPNLSNGEFLARVCQLFGLNMFANPMTKEVQLSFFSDVMQAKSFDISQWVSTEERQEFQPKEYRVHITPALAAKSVSDINVIEGADTADELPPAVVNKNKHAFVKAEKAYRRSSIIEDTSRFRWSQAGGDDRKLSAGATNAEETEEVSIEANVPNMRMVDEEIDKTKRKYLCELNIGGNSQLLDEDYNGEFDFVLQQYHGHRLLALPDGVTTTQAYIEDANPTQFTSGTSGIVNNSFLDLSADGEGSIGQKWLKPFYQFLGNCERYRFTAHLPVWAFQKVYSLLKPQNGSPAQQTRWLYIRGNRYLPVKMSFEFSESQYVVATIECAAPHVDI